jgi:hypothetical protein
MHAMKATGVLTNQNIILQMQHMSAQSYWINIPLLEATMISTL